MAWLDAAEKVEATRKGKDLLISNATLCHLSKQHHPSFSTSGCEARGGTTEPATARSTEPRYE